MAPGHDQVGAVRVAHGERAGSAVRICVFGDPAALLAAEHRRLRAHFGQAVDGDGQCGEQDTLSATTCSYFKDVAEGLAGVQGLHGRGLIIEGVGPDPLSRVAAAAGRGDTPKCAIWLLYPERSGEKAAAARVADLHGAHNRIGGGILGDVGGKVAHDPQRRPHHLNARRSLVGSETVAHRQRQRHVHAARRRGPGGNGGGGIGKTAEVGRRGAPLVVQGSAVSGVRIAAGAAERNHRPQRHLRIWQRRIDDGARRVVGADDHNAYVPRNRGVGVGHHGGKGLGALDTRRQGVGGGVVVIQPVPPVAIAGDGKRAVVARHKVLQREGGAAGPGDA